MIRTKIVVVLGMAIILVACSKQNKEQKAESKVSDASQGELLLHVPSPDWRDQIIYFVMTDRFNDGVAANNDQGQGEYNPYLESHYSGGDIQGIIDKLDYIEGLGATAVWTTPLVTNQWWSDALNYGGYHGYWATDFSSVDPHVGDIDTLKKLSDQLHRKNMYLIQDIVVNHTANLFSYEGGIDGYDPNDTAKNFKLLVNTEGMKPTPIQAPFNLIDRNNPEHVKADIYNWTPSIMDYSDTSQQFTYQLASLADINTQNPVVIDTFKQIYGDWIKNVGVDAFRIDTVRYVEHDFFHHFMHDEDGIHAAAKITGRDDFLAFGEVFDTSKPYNNDAEHKVASYLGNKQKPELNSIISFPLHHELKTVFAQGYPTDHLAYRIQQHMQVYDNPYVVPTFIDNHDMARFLASGDIAGFKQALATIMTIPGIPTIYQGTAQAMIESRQAMFKGGFLAEKDYFDQESELYQFIQSMAKLRTSDKLFTRGNLNIVAANKTGAGVLAYTRRYQGRTALIMFNTSSQDILVSDIKIADRIAKLTPLFGFNQDIRLNSDGKLTTELPGKSIMIAEVTPLNETIANKAASHISIATTPPTSVVTQDLLISGQSSVTNGEILIIKNTRLDTAIKIQTDAKGNWQYKHRVTNLGKEQVSLVAYSPIDKAVSNTLNFTTLVSQPEYVFNFIDGVGDNRGLNGSYSAPLHAQSIGQQDIESVKAEMGGEVLTLTFTMREFTNDWIPANGFDNVAFSLFFDIPDMHGATVLPMLNSQMPDGWNWDLAHVVYGWGNTTFSTEQASEKHQGQKFGVAPRVKTDKNSKTISFTYRLSDFGLSNWIGSKIYVTTWDITGEGAYRELTPEPSKWNFGGGHQDDAKILDFIELSLSDEQK
ncbi:alpha-amylase family glycosyl hydrolase [Catenovulum sediminis]|uniref:alpha-amylase family glycosyl hydrolase n=1 Tax=Catenovulum sediminis TaxID=1740262 RepID=UPI00117D3B90|nr:alpha-amylase family glycosyl hydrolase [Catenovulum sediminis]